MVLVNLIIQTMVKWSIFYVSIFHGSGLEDTEEVKEGDEGYKNQCMICSGCGSTGLHCQGAGLTPVRVAELNIDPGEAQSGAV